MANETVTISGPVNVASDSRQRVAFDLMKAIDFCASVKSEQKDRKYFFTLYRQCYKATNGEHLQYILEEK